MKVESRCLTERRNRLASPYLAEDYFRKRQAEIAVTAELHALSRLRGSAGMDRLTRVHRLREQGHLSRADPRTGQLSFPIFSAANPDQERRCTAKTHW